MSVIMLWGTYNCNMQERGSRGGNKETIQLTLVLKKLATAQAER